MAKDTSTIKPQRHLSARASLLASLLTLSSPLWAEVRASLDRNRVYQGDTLTLSIEVDGTSAPQPDLSPLGQDFEVLGTSSGTQISIVNGRRSDTTRWQVTLRPQRAGDLRIPALRVGTEHTRPLILTVADAASIPQRDAEVLVELQADLPGKTVYVQQQVPLRVRLYSAQPLRQGTLSDPQAEHAVIERLGEDKRFTTEWGGKGYQVIERQYALSPEQSGHLHIPPVVFKGSLPAERGNRSPRQTSPFDHFRNDPFFERFFSDDLFTALEPGRPVRVRSQGLDIEVKPKPAASRGHWLPAEDLILEDSWAGKVPELRVGEPVTRTLTLRARGLSGFQIPQIPLALGDAVKVYPEVPRNDTHSDGTFIYGTSQQGFTLIPQRGGELRLPEMRITWWDTRADQEREAVIPAIAASVRPGSQTPADAAPTPEPSATTNDQPSTRTAPENPSTQGAAVAWPAVQGPISRNPWLLGCAALLLLAALSGWLWRRRGVGSAHSTAPTPTPLAGTDRADPEHARQAFLAACGANDPAAAARTLLAWAAVRWPSDPPRSLNALATELSVGTEDVLRLERALYANHGIEWNGRRLRQLLAPGLSRRFATSVELAGEGLAPLYPRLS